MKRKRYVVNTQPLTITRNAIAVNPLTAYNVSSGNNTIQFPTSNVTNIIKNGDFSNGITNWTINSATGTIVDGKLNVLSTLQYGGCGQSFDVSLYKNHKMYVSLDFKADSVSCVAMLQDGIRQVPMPSNADNVLKKYSMIYTIPTNATWLGFNVQDNRANSWSTMVVDNVVLIDLTATFGANIPTQAWLDANIPFFNGTTSIPSVNALVTHGDTGNVVISGEPLLSIQEGKVITGQYIEVDNSHNNVVTQMMVLGI
jgi:hypothetical protein